MEGVFALSKRRIKFSKMGMAKYISHLDLLRCFTRAIMRGGLPVEYSQGFNPHQKMTFSLPLPVGVTSECETVDISFEDDKVTDDEIMDSLNTNLPPDIRALAIGDINKKAADITEAEYNVTLYCDAENETKNINDFFKEQEVIVMKKTKKKTEKPINIMEYIKSWEIVSQTKDGVILRLVLDAGGERNLKPDVVIAKLCERCNNITADEADIHRVKIFCKNAEGLLELFE